jgi:hypothetical protein
MIALFVFSETSPAAAGTVASSQPVTGCNANYLAAGIAGPLDDFESLNIDAELKGATGGTLNVYLQQSPDNGTNWYDVISWAQLAGGAAQIYYSSPMSLSTTTTTPVVVGKNLAPALAPGAVVNGSWSDRFRLVMVAGTGTSAGAQVTVRISPQRARSREHGE